MLQSSVGNADGVRFVRDGSGVLFRVWTDYSLYGVLAGYQRPRWAVIE